MAGRNNFESGWMALGLLILCFTSYCSVVEGFSETAYVESFDTAVVSVEEGETFLLPCKNKTRTDIVYWTSWSSLYDLVLLDLSATPPARSGKGYDDRLFNMTDDFSLVIHEVKPEHEDLYGCFMWDYTNNINYQQSTVILVNKKGPPMITTDTLSTEITPNTDCPTDDVYKVVFGVSVAALVLSWILIPCSLDWMERRCVNYAFTPLARRAREDEEGRGGGGEAD